MTNLRISELPAATTPIAGTEQLAIVQGSETRRVAASALGGSSALDGYVNSNWINPFECVVAAGSAPPANTICLIPFRLTRSITIDGLAARLTGTGATNAQLGIYASNVTTGLPTGNVLINTGNLATGTAGLLSETPLTPVTLSAGVIYWAGVNLGAGGPIFQTMTGAFSSKISTMIGSATLANISSGNTAMSLHLRVSQTFGTWPDLTSASFTETVGTHSAIIFMHISGLP